MGAHIPTCTKQDYLGVCPCDNCKSFLPMSKANKIIKSYLDLDKMSDLIDRDALEPFYESGTDPNDTYADMTFIRVEHIENAPAVNRWIPCSERLPENRERVLVCFRSGTVHIAVWYGDYDEKGAWKVTSQFPTKLYRTDTIPKWMPMPDTYEPQETEERGELK